MRFNHPRPGDCRSYFVALDFSMTGLGG
jgi:hypothetical protein